MNQNIRTHVIAIALSAFGFIFYLLTLAPSVDFIDAGELATVTCTLGIAHPTGYPLFTMVGWLWSHLPIGDEIYRLNVFSAVLCAAGVGVFFELIYFLISIPKEKKRVIQKSKKKTAQKSTVEKLFTDTEKYFIAGFGALAIGFSETYWSTALSIEVYALHCLMISITLYFFLRSRFSIRGKEGSFWNRYKYWLLFAFTLGLSFTNHLTTILLAPACLYLFFAQEKFSKTAWQKIGIAVPAFAAGLLPYLYFPIRAASHPTMNWGNPSSWERFLWHVSGKQYRTWMFSSTEAAGRQLNYFIQTFPSEFGYILLPFILIGFVYVFKIKKQLGIFLLLLFFGCLLYSINYDIHDIESYFLLAYITSGILSAFGLIKVLQWLSAYRAWFPAVAVVSIGVVIGVLFSRVSERDNYLVEDYTNNMFRSLDQNALIISYQWDYFVAASYYYQKVKHVRPDVTVIDKELLRRSWYYEQIRHNYPDLYEKSKAEIEAFLPELKKFEHDEPYDPMTIENTYNAMVNSFIDHNFNERPVYVTIEIEQQFAPGFVRVPEGLAFRLYKQIPPPDKKVFDEFVFRSVNKHARLIDGIMSMYASMLTNRGRYLYSQKEFIKAATYFERALQFNSSDQEALRWQEMNRQMMTGKT